MTRLITDIVRKKKRCRVKKSKIISKLIMFHEDVFPSVGRGLSQQEYFSEMLDMLEQEGMAPPFYDKVQNNNGEECVVPAREWEPE